MVVLENSDFYTIIRVPPSLSEEKICPGPFIVGALFDSPPACLCFQHRGGTFIIINLVCYNIRGWL